MKLKYILSLFLITSFNAAVFAQNYNITLQKTIGGSGTDKLTQMIPTLDKGFILCGFSNSNTSGDKHEDAVNNSYDFWVVKLDSLGAILWSKTYGGSDRDIYPTVIATQDSGFLVAGSSISPASGSKTENAIGQSFDYWVIKLNKNGNLVWDNTLGGIQFEKLAALVETSSGYFLCGSANSNNAYDKTAPNEGSSLWADYWIVKLNKSGVVLWDSTYGSKNRDVLTAAKGTSDGGLILGGSSYSPKYANKSQNEFGNNDYWIVKLDSLGRKKFDKTIGGALSDYLTSIDIVGTSGYVLAGYSNSPASFSKTDSCRGVTDYWIVKVNNSGGIVWNKTYGGSKEDYATSVSFSKNTFLVGGYSNSPVSKDKTAGNYGGMDYWVLRLDVNGNLLDQSGWGSSGDDSLTTYFRDPKDANSYWLGGTSSSPVGNSKNAGTVDNTGLADYWILKIKAGKVVKQTTQTVTNAIAVDIKKLQLNIAPNPVTNTLNVNYSTINAQKSFITIYSNSGKPVKQAVLQNTSGTYSLDFSMQPAGVYYVLLQNGNSSITKKVIKY
jgi:hypothetical protein